MKRLHETFTDQEFKILVRAKGNRTWRQALLDWAKRDLEMAPE